MATEVVEQEHGTHFVLDTKTGAIGLVDTVGAVTGMTIKANTYTDITAECIHAVCEHLLFEMQKNGTSQVSVLVQDPVAGCCKMSVERVPNHA